jgi:hypothetical protein
MNIEIDTILDNNVCKVIVGDKNKHGTGFLISNEFILTAFHVVRDFTNNIKVKFESIEKEIKVELSELIDKNLKDLDIALLKINNPDLIYKPIPIMETSLYHGQEWRSKGFPSLKPDGEKLTSTISQYFQKLQIKHDLELDVDKGKHKTFSGMSGAPVIVNNSIVAIINQNLSNGENAVELKALSIKYFRDLLNKIGINVKEGNLQELENNKDFLSEKRWQELDKTKDIRNIKEKIQSVCNTMTDRKINNYNRKAVLGKEEQSIYEDRDISAVKYIVFEKCQDRLIDFYEINKNKEQLNTQEIESFLETYISDAKKIIIDKSKVNNYPPLSDDFVTKLILNLIDECFLSFDEEGIYYE